MSLIILTRRFDLRFLLPATLALSYVLMLNGSGAAQSSNSNVTSSHAQSRAEVEQRHRKAREAEANAQRALDQARAALASAERANDAEAVALARQAVSIGEQALNKARSLRAAEEARLEALEKDLNRSAAISDKAPYLLAVDPKVARIVRARLDEVNGRLSRLKKAIEILGSENPEWRREWARLRGDMVENSFHLLWVSLDTLTLGLAETYKYAKSVDVATAEAVLGEIPMSEIARQRESLEKLRRGWVGPPGGGLDKWIAELGELQRAVKNKNVAECISTLRDLVAEAKDVCERARQASQTREPIASLYDASLILGQLSIIFVEGVGAKWAAGAGLLAGGIEAGLLVKLLVEEKQQLKELSERAYDRNQKKLELLRKAADLESERSGLEWALERAVSKDK